MTNYGLSKYQIQKAKDKVKFNKEFMQSNGIQLDNKMIPFSDFVANSYINSDRYIAELQHRAWSVYEYANERDLKNIFLTLTLPSKWHKQKKFKDKFVKNKKFAGRTYITTLKSPIDKKKYKFLNVHVKQNIPFIEPILDFSNTIDKYTPRNASKELSKLLKKFFDDRAYKSIQKENRCYFRVTEPHKNGTPHVHMSLFVPADKVEKIVKSLNRLFPVPQSKIETGVDSPVAYLMKYVLKTLDDLREDNDKISNLTLWYLYHGISRFYTSRTFVSLNVYRKLNGMYNLIDLTKNVHSGGVSVFFYSSTKEIAFIENEHGTIYVPKPVNWSEKLDFEDRLSEDKSTIQIDSGFETVYKEVPLRKIDIKIDNQDYFIYSNELKKLGSKETVFDIMRHSKKQPYQMKNYQLKQYFDEIDISTVNPTHYAHTTNLMIERGLINGSKLNLDTPIEEVF